MKLQIKFVDYNGGRVLMLCDESGDPLPDQLSVTVRQEPQDVARVTVEFVIGGDVRLGDAD